MRRYGKRFALIPMLTVISLVSFHGPGASPRQDATPRVARAESLTATVRTVDVKARRLEVITGVGLALRLVPMQVDPACKIRVRGAMAELADVETGRIVRIQYRRTAERKVAESIETLEMAPAGGNR